MEKNNNSQLDFFYFLLEQGKLTLEEAKSIQKLLEKYIEKKEEESSDEDKTQDVYKKPYKEPEKEVDPKLKEKVGSELEDLLAGGQISPEDAMKFKGLF